LKANLSIALACMTLTWKLALQSSENTLSSKIFSQDAVMASATAIFGPVHLKLLTCGVFSKYILQRTCLSLFCLYVKVDIFSPFSLKTLKIVIFLDLSKML